MPHGEDSHLKDLELYEELRRDGASKEKAARISNAARRHPLRPLPGRPKNNVAGSPCGHRPKPAPLAGTRHERAA